MKENAASQQKQKEADDFIEKYRVKGGNCYDPNTRKVVIPVDWATPPESSLMVRELENAGVKLLMASLLKGVQTMELIAVMWLDHPSTLTSLKDLADITFDTTQKAPPRPIMMIDGLHRATAMQGCHKSYPKKPLYQNLSVILLIIPRTRPNIQLCLFIGNSHNNATQTVVKTTQWQVVKQYRRQLEWIQTDTSLSADAQAKAFHAYKHENKDNQPFEDNTLHTFSAVVQVDGRVFDMMRKIFNGEYKYNKELKGQRTPDAMTHFVNMAGIPVDNLCQWLQRVVDGEWLTSTFMKRCKIYTKQMKVTNQITEHMQVLRPSYNFKTIEAVAKVYPKVLDAEWFDMVVASCDDAVKAKLSSHAIVLIEDMVAMTEKIWKEPTVRFEAVMFCLFCTLFFGVRFDRFLICRIPSP